MERKIQFSIGEFYHVYNRGVEKRTIFLDDRDRVRFQKLLYVSNGTRPVIFREIKDKALGDIQRGEPLVAIGAYCLMPNHFHLLLKETKEGGISAFMEKITTAYAKYFNKKHQRVGSLFESRFKAEHVDRDEYLKYLFSYIHLNPIKLIEPRWKEGGIKNTKRAEQYLRHFSYSSYLDYLGPPREEQKILFPKEFPQYFAHAQDFREYLRDWLNYQRQP